jgi:hypothetical protein
MQHRNTNLLTAVTNARFAPSTERLVGPVPSRPRSFHFAKSRARHEGHSHVSRKRRLASVGMLHQGCVLGLPARNARTE